MSFDHELLIRQLEALAETSGDMVALMANASALIDEALDDINWAGFYLVKDGALLLGPFQGKNACVRIEKGRGVCGTAWEKDEVQLVKDVHQFPGHIACDSASNSEIVIPMHGRGEVRAVLDIDSPSFDRFVDEEEGLVKVAGALEKLICWE